MFQGIMEGAMKLKGFAEFMAENQQRVRDNKPKLTWAEFNRLQKHASARGRVFPPKDIVEGVQSKADIPPPPRARMVYSTNKLCWVDIMTGEPVKTEEGDVYDNILKPPENRVFCAIPQESPIPKTGPQKASYSPLLDALTDDPTEVPEVAPVCGPGVSVDPEVSTGDLDGSGPVNDPSNDQLRCM